MRSNSVVAPSYPIWMFYYPKKIIVSKFVFTENQQTLIDTYLKFCLKHSNSIKKGVTKRKIEQNVFSSKKNLFKKIEIIQEIFYNSIL